MTPWSREEVLAFVTGLEKQLATISHFDLLDVPRDADPQTIQDAFHRRANQLHPDRHRKVLTVGELERLTTVYARIAEAYRVLRDDNERARYIDNQAASDSQQATPQGDEPAAVAVLSPKSQTLYHSAMECMRGENYTGAIMELKDALRQDPESRLLKRCLSEAQTMFRTRPRYV